MGVVTRGGIYRRGVPNRLRNFGLVASGNYSIVQPVWPLIESSYTKVKPPPHPTNVFNKFIRTL
jgi:hypothetical protein